MIILEYDYSLPLEPMKILLLIRELYSDKYSKIVYQNLKMYYLFYLVKII